MEMNKEHRYFDIAMELLCSISPTKGVPEADICYELHISKRNCENAIKKLLLVNAIKINTTREQDGKRMNILTIEQSDIEKAREVAERYWNRVYGPYRRNEDD